MAEYAWEERLEATGELRNSSFNSYLLRTYYLTGPALGSRDTEAGT